MKFINIVKIFILVVGISFAAYAEDWYEDGEVSCVDAYANASLEIPSSPDANSPYIPIYNPVELMDVGREVLGETLSAISRLADYTVKGASSNTLTPAMPGSPESEGEPAIVMGPDGKPVVTERNTDRGEIIIPPK
jgi:hypothetical protein